MKNQPVAGTLVWTSVLFLLASLIIVAIFLTAVPPSGRNTGFYVWLATLCMATFVCFAWTTNYTISRRTGRRASGAVMVMVHFLIVLWFIITVILAFVGAKWSAESGRYTDTLGLMYAALTFMFLLGASALYRRDLAVQQEDRVTQVQRVRLQVHTEEVNQVCYDLRKWANENADHTVAVDRLVKKLEGVRTSLDFSPPGKIGTLEESDGRNVHEINNKIVTVLEELKSRLAELQRGSSDPAERLAGIDNITNRIESLLRQRQQQLLIGGTE